MDKNLYQKDVARTIGVSENCIVGWENNRSNPQIRYMPAIIKFLGYTPELKPELDEISKKIKNLRNQRRMKLRDLAKEIGIDERTLSYIEKGEFCLRPELRLLGISKKKI